MAVPTRSEFVGAQIGDTGLEGVRLMLSDITIAIAQSIPAPSQTAV